MFNVLADNIVDDGRERLAAQRVMDLFRCLTITHSDHFPGNTLTFFIAMIEEYPKYCYKTDSIQCDLNWKKLKARYDTLDKIDKSRKSKSTIIKYVNAFSEEGLISFETYKGGVIIDFAPLLFQKADQIEAEYHRKMTEHGF